MTIAAELTRRGINEIVHFTTNRGIVGILATGALLSRRHLPNEKFLQYIGHPNALSRTEDAAHFDKSEDWLNFVNLSISEINRSYFKFSNRWSHNSEIFWTILVFDPVIVTHNNVHFATTNNVYPFCDRAKGLDGFNALFADTVRRKATWRAVRGTRSLRLTTCEQAELLYPDRVPLEFLRKIYVRNDENHDQVGAWLKMYAISQVSVEIAPAKFNGVPN